MDKSRAPQAGGKKVIKVLIVDDIPETRENLKKLLAFENDIEVVGTASTGREGLELAKDLLPDIILMDINMPDMDGIQATELINKEVRTASVIMMSVQSEADYLRRALQAGASDFLTKPIAGEELYSTIRQVYDRGATKRAEAIAAVSVAARSPSLGGESTLHNAQVIAVYSPQGGAGATTVATNVASSLMAEGTKVLLLDADLQFGDVGVFLNIQAANTIVDLIHGVEDLDPEVVNNVLVNHESGLRVLLAPRAPEDAEEVLADKLQLLIEKLRGNFDFIVVDMASKIDDVALSLFDSCERIILVLNPTLPAVKNTRSVLNLFDKLQIEQNKVMLVFNRVNAELERQKVNIPIASIEKNFNRKAVAYIPEDGRRVLSAINRGITVVAKDKNLSPAKELIALSDTVRSSFLTAEETPAIPAELSKSSTTSKTSGGLFRRG
ncbi:MAG TPA: response regulator [Aggregatilineales bacterium]|nr:response regulator [Aggregatilineales bacterium]